MTVVDVIVVARNEENTIGATLESIASQRSQDGVSFKVLVVPNGCTDRTAEVVSETIASLVERSDMVFEVAESDQTGKNRALNFALGRTQAPLVFCVDADVTFPKDSFGRVLHSFDNALIRVSGAEPNVIINEGLSATLLGGLYRVRQLRRIAVGARLTPFGNFMAFRRGVVDGFPDDFVGADNSWLAFEVARQYGWEAVTVAEGAEALAVPPQNWVDFIRQESRWELNLRRLLEHFPELVPVADERDGRVAVERLFTAARRRDVLERMRQEGISPEILDLCELVPKILRDNASLMDTTLARVDGTWEAIRSTKVVSQR